MQLPDRLVGPIAIDTETNDKDLDNRGPGWCFDDGGYIAGISLSCDNVERLYLPIAHEGGGNMDRDLVVRYLQDQLSDENQIKIFANAAYDLGWLSTEGIQVRGPIEDVLVACPLLDEHRFAYDLDTIGKDYLGVGKSTEALEEFGRSHFGCKTMKAIKKSMWRFPADVVREYAEQDAWVTRELYRKFKPMLLEEELENVYTLEMGLIPALMDMRRRGIRVDLDKAEKTLQQLLQKERELVAEIKRLTGVEIKPSDSKSAGPALEAVGIECPLTPKTRKPSVKKEWLESLEGEVPDLINRARTINKIHGTFITNAILEHHHNGRIHSELLSVKGEGGGTVGGRFSSRNPNMQQVPARDPELAPMIRDMFLPEEGELWCAVDYSSQEPRFTLHFGVAVGAPGARKIADTYWEDTRTDYHSLVAEICGVERKPAKTINLGLAYGMGEAALCRKLGLPTKFVESRNGKVYEVAGEEGAAILARYHEAMPFLRQLDRVAKSKANDRHFVRTVSGRKCRFKVVNGKVWDTHKALNRIVQGSSADQTKRAMVELYKAGIPMLMSIHDEIDFSVPADGTADYVRNIEHVMTQCVPDLNVPFVVDSEVGPTWGTARLLSLDD